MAHQYTESGLNNVVLENGYEVHETKYGRGVSIHNTEGLHRVIGRWLIDLPKPLAGAELRFLRLEMDLSQARLADLLGSQEQNVQRWESARTKPIPGLADRLIRVLYSQYSGGDTDVRRMVDRLAELDQIERAKACVRETEAGWQVAAVAC
jgi:putative transcriptional regulator